MNIAIVGAGIVGLSTALELARDGHQVSLYEQQQACAELDSFAPGGWLAPCALSPLATPGCGMPLGQLRQGRAPLLQAKALFGGSNWRWLRRWTQAEAAHPKASSPAARQLQQLQAYSQLQRWQDGGDPSVLAERKAGQMLLLRTEAEVNAWTARLHELHTLGIASQLLTEPQARMLEPGLGQEIPLAGALNFPDGESINSRLWSQHLRQQIVALGVSLHTGARVQRLQSQPPAVVIDGQAIAHEAVILCTGAAGDLLADCGIRPALKALYGYSVTAPVRDPLLAPRTAVMDWARQSCITRLGQRVRITAGAEFDADRQDSHSAETLQQMYQLLNDWFPGGVQLSSPQVQVWRGARGMLPDGLPLIGPAAAPGLWLNLGHGSHGVALAPGSARALADMLGQRAPAIEMQAFAPARF